MTDPSRTTNTRTFRKIVPLEIPYPPAGEMEYVAVVDSDKMVTIEEADLDVAQATALRDWLNSALPAQPDEPSVWQPIETAPQDGRRILVLSATGWHVASAGWDNATPDKIRWEVVNDITVRPTHWMPLPAKPTAETKTGCRE